MKRLIVVVMAALALNANANACDIEAANADLKKLANVGTWEEINGIVEFTFGSEFDNFTTRTTLLTISAFANADTCVTGGVRKINFFRTGKLVGSASARGVNVESR